MKPKKYKCISRIDSENKNTYGWYVRVRLNGQNISKFFSDGVWGGKEKALEEAIKHRDKVEKEIGKPQTKRTVVTCGAKNNTGVVGVRLRTDVYKRADGGERVRLYYEVSWNPSPKKLCRTRVSIDQYGQKQALLKACAIRRQKEEEMYGSVIRPNWVAAFGKLV